MSDANALVQQAVQAYKAHNKAAAKELLLKAVDMDERNEQAWMWMSAVVDSPEEQQICLENVLQINPNNDRARKGLATLKQKLGASGAAPASSSPAPPPTPVAPAGFDSGPFGGWDQPISDLGGIPTSVDWGKSSDAPAPGSDKPLNTPSPQEYDAWIESLGINGQSTGSGGVSPFTSDDPWASVSSIPSSSSAPPSAAPFQIDAASADPWANVGRGGTNPFDTGDLSDTWGVSPSSTPAEVQPGPPSAPPSVEDDPWGTSKLADEAEGGSGARFTTSSAFSSANFDEPEPLISAYEPEDSASGFAFDFDDDTSADSDVLGVGSYDFAFGEDEALIQDDPFAEVGDLSFEDIAESFGKAGVAADVSEYYDYLPQEFRIKKAAASSKGMLAAAMILFLLNIAALVGLVLA